jgi:hypothetical protein
MDMLVRNLRILWRTERLLAEQRLRQVVRRVSLLSLAAVLGLFAVAMLNVAGYLYLVPLVEPTGAALVVAAADAVVAALLALAGLPQKPGPEVRVLEEIRDMALSDLETEARSVQNDLRHVRTEIEDMRQAVTSFARNPLEGVSPQLIAPVISMLTNLLRSKKE